MFRDVEHHLIDAASVPKDPEHGSASFGNGVLPSANALGDTAGIRADSSPVACLTPQFSGRALRGPARRECIMK
jgi:hypothetical protein